MPPSSPYGADLALIHDGGFGHVARAAAHTLLGALRSQGVLSGTIVDLGCGSGILAAELAAAGYDILGVDLSPEMLKLARRRVPSGKFQCESVLDAQFPRCVAVAAIGEVFNYLFDARNSAQRLQTLLKRIWRALDPGGVFLTDIAAPGRVPAGQVRTFAQTEQWSCLYEATEDRQRGELTRRITTYRRRRGTLFTREEEVHRLRLIPPAEFSDQLRSLGFRVRRLRQYDGFAFPPGWNAFLARK